jgi:hypothetical protein
MRLCANFHGAAGSGVGRCGLAQAWATEAEAAVTRDALVERVGALADRVLSDPRWDDERDDLGVSVLGMLLYGFALATGRIVMFLDMEDIDAAVFGVVTERVGAAAKWSGGLVEEANRSAFDKAYHPGQHELIGVGHSYFGVEDQAAIMDNVFANVQSVRRRAGGGT